MIDTIYLGDHDNIYAHLAFEELLLDRVRAGEKILYLWSSSDSVVLGKHQNPWQECPVAGRQLPAVRIARRISGGGAVFHDAGNLNFSFICSRDTYSFADQMNVIRGALARSDVQAVVEGRALVVGGKKCSGNSFCFRRGGAIHHGTLLVGANLDRLERYLVPALADIDSRATRSVRAEVVNLATLDQTMTVDGVRNAIVDEVESISSRRPTVRAASGVFDAEAMRRRVEQRSSWEWIFGTTPRFTVEWRVPIGDTQFDLSVAVAKGRIEEVSRRDPPGMDGILESIAAAIKDTPFHAAAVVDRLRGASLPAGSRPVAVGLAEFLEKMSF